MQFLVDLLPVIGFFVPYKLAGIYVATAAAIGATFLQIGLLALLRRKIGQCSNRTCPRSRP